MLKNRDIIIFGDDWGRFPSTIQHIGRELAKDNRIIWVGSLGLRKPELKLSDLKRVIQKLRSMIKKNSLDEKKNSPVIEVYPFVLPFHDFTIARWINKILLVRKLRTKLKENNFRNPILISSSPVIGNLVGHLNESSVHYFCLDDYSLFNNAFRTLPQLEKELLNKADTCFAISEALLSTRRPVTDKAYFLPQGADVEHFSSKRLNKIIELGNNKPVIGFFGLLAPWVDIELIIRSAKENPQYEFLIIGRVDTDISGFTNIPNIKFLGEIPYNELPAYAQLFHVGLIPFRVNNLTVACNPLKLIEYLAMGIPVVSTNLPEVKKFGEFVFVAESNDAFAKLIRDAVADRTPERDLARFQKAKEYSWESITEKISQVITDIEDIKRNKK